jgi:transposase
MSQTASASKYSEGGERLYLAFELGWKVWKIAFTVGLGERVFEASMDARDLERLVQVIDRARRWFGLWAQCPVISCYEAGRDGFWLDRWLWTRGIANRVVDSSSIQVDRRARRLKTDRLDARKLLTMLVRYEAGDRGVWSVVKAPTEAQEDARHLHRELRTLKKEQTRLINRIKGLLASQGACVRMGRNGLLKPLEQIRIWDGSPLREGLRARIQRELERHDFVHKQVLDLEAETRTVVRESSEIAMAQVRRLMALRGVGRTSASILIREFGWRGFRNRRQVGSLSGLTPTPFQSGSSMRQGSISRAGNRHVRGIAVDLAWAWLRFQPDSDLSHWYLRRFACGGSRLRRIGIVAVARKLLIALWRFWATGQLPGGAILKSSAA